MDESDKKKKKKRTNSYDDALDNAASFEEARRQLLMGRYVLPSVHPSAIRRKPLR